MEPGGEAAVHATRAGRAAAASRCEDGFVADFLLDASLEIRLREVYHGNVVYEEATAHA